MGGYGDRFVVKKDQGYQGGDSRPFSAGSPYEAPFQSTASEGCLDLRRRLASLVDLDRMKDESGRPMRWMCASSMPTSPAMIAATARKMGSSRPHMSAKWSATRAVGTPRYIYISVR